MLSYRIGNQIRAISQQLKWPTTHLLTATNAIAFDCIPTLPTTTNTGAVRYYAKQKDKLKEKARDKGVKFARMELSNERLNEIFNVDNFTGQLQKAIDTMQSEFIKNLSVRSTTGAIEQLKIVVDGQDHELQQLAQIVRKNPKTIVLNMISFPQAIPMVLQALQKSGMNLNPQQDGTTIFIPVPKVTKEHREMLSKSAKSLFIKCRDGIRDAQNNVIRKLKKQTDMSQDENRSIQVHVTAMADKYVQQATQLMETKQKELLGDAAK